MNSISIAAYIAQLENENKELRKELVKFYEESVGSSESVADEEEESVADEEEDTDTDTDSDVSEDDDYFITYNEDLTDALNSIAYYETNEHKKIAYEKAAEAVYHLPYRVKSGKDLASGPNKVPGIGKCIAAKIDDFLKNKKTIELESNPVSTNEEIAWHLDILGSLEEDEHRRTAYKNAATAIRTLDFEVTNGDELSKGPLKVRGIGKSIAAKIDEFLQTGKIQRIDDLS